MLKEIKVLISGMPTMGFMVPGILSDQALSRLSSLSKNTLPLTQRDRPHRYCKGPGLAVESLECTVVCALSNKFNYIE
jgi:hypothetical protein